MTLSLADILAPITPAQFFAEYQGKKWLHIPGTPGKFANVMAREKVDELLSTIGLWNPQSLQIARDRSKLSANAYSQGDKVDAAKVKALLADGASLVLNDIDLQAPGLTGIDDVARALESALEAKVQANLYSSPRARQALGSHFDAHDVYAVHLAGEKTWQIYEGRIDRPIEHPVFTKKNDPQDAERAKGKLAAEVLMKPGDLLYLPRGQYHDALAQSERAIHIAFGVVSVIGMDVISALFTRAVEEAMFREDMPRRHGIGPNSGEAAFDARIAAIGKRLAELSTSPDVVQALHKFQDEYRFRAPKEETRFALTSGDFTVVSQNGLWVLARGGKGAPIPPGLDRAVAWIVAEKTFTPNRLMQAFPLLDEDSCGELLRSLAAMKVIEPY